MCAKSTELVVIRVVRKNAKIVYISKGLCGALLLRVCKTAARQLLCGLCLWNSQPV